MIAWYPASNELGKIENDKISYMNTWIVLQRF